MNIPFVGQYGNLINYTSYMNTQPGSNQKDAFL